MKPIRLEIEGINSYHKKQIIDFELLTSRGIFGIFGKTGSGKSTILDAITLALYGNIARGTKEFINSNSEKAIVDYEFELGVGDDRSVYKISRRFRKKKYGMKHTFTSDYVRFMKKSIGESEYTIIADKVGDANKSIKDILGLEESDFLKSVVLPQGKFNEFLTLTGKDRRNMLERIFGLEEYGTILSMRLSREKAKNNTKIEVLKGRLLEYPDVNIESKNDLEKNLANVDVEIKKIESKLKNSDSKLRALEEARELFNQRKNILSDISEHKSKKEEFEKLSNRVVKLENALSIIPEIETFKSVKNTIAKKSKELEESKIEFDRENLVLENLKNDSIKLSNRVSKLPKILIATREIDSLIEIIESCKEKNDSLVKTEIECKKYEKDKKNLSLKIDEIKLEIVEIDKKIEFLKNMIFDNKVDSDEKERVIKCIGIAENLLKALKEKSTIINSSSNIDVELSSLESNNKLLVKQIDVIEENVKIREMKNLASKVRENFIEHFHENNSCPVCNSVIMDVSKLEDFDDYKTKNIEDENELSDLKIKLENSKSEIVRLKSKLSFNSELLDKNNAEIESFIEVLEVDSSFSYEGETVQFTIDKECKKIDLDDFDILMETIEKEKKNIEKYIQCLNMLLSSIKRSENTLNQINNDIEATIIHKNKILELKDTNNKIIINIELELALKKKAITDITNDLNTLYEKYKSISKNINLGELNNIAKISDFEKFKLDAIFEEFDYIQLRDIKNELSTAYDNIEENYEKNSKMIEDKTTTVLNLKTHIENLGTEIKTNNVFKEQHEKKINELISKLDFISYDEVFEYKSDESEIIEIKSNIEKYKSEKMILNSKLEEINHKIDKNYYFEKEESVEEEIENEKENNKLFRDNLDSMKDSSSKYKHDLDKMIKSLKVVKEIVYELEVCEKHKDSIDMLDKVLRGNKFVEYLSQIYLKNIVLDASKRLDYITKGRYSIEINSEYSFVIRDNFNGGIRRAADTLSGGETFLTSLSLALALSSQIQLKGSAPLEFFFLDEGFGTLDEELLDTVMESLEMLKNNTMSVGIISHVEELKNRVPVKLNVEMDLENSTSVAVIDIS